MNVRSEPKILYGNIKLQWNHTNVWRKRELTFSSCFKALMACITSSVSGAVLFTMFYEQKATSETRRTAENMLNQDSSLKKATCTSRHTHTWTSSLIRVILWKGSTRKERRGSLWQTGLLSNFSTILLNPAFSFLREIEKSTVVLTDADTWANDHHPLLLKHILTEWNKVRLSFSESLWLCCGLCGIYDILSQDRMYVSNAYVWY